MTWRADPNTQYWMVGFDLTPRAQIDTRSDEDNAWYESGNYFRYHVMADKAAMLIRSMLAFTRGDAELETVVEQLLAAKKRFNEVEEESES